MSAASRVTGAQRYRSGRVCPICGGSEDDDRGTGKRCYGFVSDDGLYAHCSREELAGSISESINSNTFGHRLKGSCKCGVEHGQADPEPGPSRKGKGKPKGRIVAVYPYTDEADKLLYEAVRRADPKGFTQRRPAEVPNTYHYSLEGVRRVLYRLSALVAADPAAPVFVAEGEKDVDTLRAKGLVATCNAMGAGKWIPEEYNGFLKGRAVWIIPDNDDPGRDHAESIARSLDGVAREVKVLDLADLCRNLKLGDLPEKGDASDFLAMGGKVADLIGAFEFAPAFVANSEPAADEDGPSEDVVDRWPVIDEAAYHGIAGEIIRAAMPHTEADPVAVLIQFLVGFANALGRFPHWVVGPTKHYMVMFAALVGPTATGRKGSSWDVAKFFVSRLDEAWATKRVTQGLSSGEGLIYHVRDPVTKTDDDGDEVEVEEGVKDKRLLCIESELGRTLKAMARESNTLSAVLRQAWDCTDHLATLTKNSTNVATCPHISVIGHITSDELESLFKGTETANGFGNRFLWLCVRRSKSLPGGGDFYPVDWEPVIARLKEAFDVARGISRMKLDAESREIWDGVYHQLSDGLPGPLGAMLARAEAQVMRLSCIYALLDGSKEVRPPHLTAALAIWEYAEKSARFIFGEQLGDAKAEKLLGALKAAPQGMKRSEISIKVFGRNLNAEKLGALLERLLSMGLIHRVEQPRTTGRPAELWFAGRIARATR